MKKVSLKVATALLAISMLSSSCIGSFSLFNSYEKWQCNMTDSKIVNGIVGLFLQPIVGGVCLFVDAVVLNTIEFWTGSNPMANNVGKTKTVMGQDGRYYAVKFLKDGYEVKAPTGEITIFHHDATNDSWSMMQNGEVKEMFRFNADGTICVNLGEGKTINVTNDQAGLNQVRQAMHSDFLLADR